MSSHFSSGGWSELVSMAASSVGWGVEDDASGSGFFSLLLSEGGFGGCAEDMAKEEDGGERRR